VHFDCRREARDRQKARSERRIALVKAEYAARSAQRERAGRLIGEALAK
jgi:hypothetical protein